MTFKKILRKGSQGGGGGGVSATGFAGIHVSMGGFGSSGNPNLANANGIEYQNGSGWFGVPAANRSSTTGAILSMPADATGQIRWILNIPPDQTKHYRLDYDAGNGVTAISTNYGTISSVTTGLNGHADWLPVSQQPDPSPTYIIFTVSGGGIPPKNVRLIPVSMAGQTYNTDFLVKEAQLCQTNSWMSFMKASWTELNANVGDYNPYPTNPGTYAFGAPFGGTRASPVSPFTYVNKETSEIWTAEFPGPVTGYICHDGLPVSFQVKLAWNTKQCHALCFGQTYFSDAQVYEHTQLALNALSPTQKLRICTTNEPWNAGYGRQSNQAEQEASDYGLNGAESFTFNVSSVVGTTMIVSSTTGVLTTVAADSNNAHLIGGNDGATAGIIRDTKLDHQVSGSAGGAGTYILSNTQPNNMGAGTFTYNRGGYYERLIQIAIHQAVIMAQAATDLGMRSRLEIVFCGQRDNNTNYALTYKPAGSLVALKDVIDVFMTSGYMEPTTLNAHENPVVSYTSSQFIAAMDANIGPILDACARDKAIVEGYGLKYGMYEYGDEFDGVEASFASTVMANPDMRTHRVKSLQQAKQKLGTSPVSVVFDWDPVDNFGAYGCREYEGGPLSQQGLGQVDYCSGTRIAVALTSLNGFSAVQGNPNGTHVGYIDYAVESSVFTLANNDGGRLAINASTGEITIANTSLLTGASYGRTLVIRDTNPGYAAPGYLDTTFNYNVFATGTGPTVWIAATDYSLDSTHKIATHTNVGTDGIIKGSNYHSGTGDWYYKLTTSGSGVYFVGLANVSMGTNGWYMGSSNDSIGVNQANGQIIKNNAVVGNLGTSGWSDSTTELTIRLKNNKLYIALNGTYLLGDPVAQTGGIDVTSMGGLTPAVSSSQSRSFTLTDTSNWLP